MQSGTRHGRLTRWLEMFTMSWRNVPFEWKNREEGGEGGGCGRIMISKKRQGEAEPEGTRKDKPKSG